MIADQMAETRRALSEKVATLEDVFRTTIREASAAVRGRVRSTRTAAEGVVDKIAGQVQSALDVSGHVRANPWATLAGSFAAGFLAGLASRRSVSETAIPAPPISRAAATPSPTTAERVRGKADAFLDRIVNELGDTAIALIRGVAAGLERDVPARLTGMIDRLAEPADRLTQLIGHSNGSAGSAI
jgi:ElaB/YqjD/DUF883 family membrane-anchored ribosome-binding protein